MDKVEKYLNEEIIKKETTPSEDRYTMKISTVKDLYKFIKIVAPNTEVQYNDKWTIELTYYDRSLKDPDNKSLISVSQVKK